MFENSIDSTKLYMFFPFKGLKVDGILNITIISENRCYLKMIDHYNAVFYDINEVYVGEAVLDSRICKIMHGDTIVGYVETFEFKPHLSKEFLFNQTEIWPSCISHQRNYSGIYNIFEEGHNVRISVNGNTIQIIPDKGAGKGEYCGDSRKIDGIYTVNGIQGPDLEWIEQGFFRISTGQNTIYFDTIIPDELCFREGLSGPKGPDGIDGTPGKDGEDAIELIMVYEEECSI